MSGFKTWIAVIGALLLAVYYLLQGDVQRALQYFTVAFALLGIGHKLDKIRFDK